MYDFYSIIQALRHAGHIVLPGITNQDIELAKKTYDITFPRALRKFYEFGIPCTFNCSYHKQFCTGTDPYRMVVCRTDDNKGVDGFY